MRVLVTRPEPGLSRTAARLTAIGMTALRLPLSRTVPLVEGVAEAVRSEADVLVATSAAAVSAVAGRVAPSTPIWTVGVATAAAARRAGFMQVFAGPGDGTGLAARLAADLPAGTRALYLAGRIRSPDLEDGIAATGIALEVVDVYDTLSIDYKAQSLTQALGKKPCDAVLVYSRFAARRLGALIAENDPPALAQTAFCCLSDNVAAGLHESAGRRVLIAARPEEDALLALLGR